MSCVYSFENWFGGGLHSGLCLLIGRMGVGEEGLHSGLCLNIGKIGVGEGCTVGCVYSLEEWVVGGGGKSVNSKYEY